MAREQEKQTIALSANTAWFIWHFHKELVVTLLEYGHTVHIITPYDKEYSGNLQDLGCKCYNINITRSGTNPLHELLTLIKYIQLLYRLKPHTLLTFTIKPVIYGGIASRILSIHTISTITGLGRAFMHQGLLQSTVQLLYRLALCRSDRVFMLNNDDASLFINNNIITKQQLQILPGAGVNLEMFRYSPPHKGTMTTFIYIGRLLEDKGLLDFIEAGRLLHKQGCSILLQVLGPFDVGNPSAVSNSDLKSLCDYKGIEYLGETPDVRPYILASTCVVLPSRREGVPTVLLEAMAMGRPIITTDAPGCREVIQDTKNGYCVPTKDVVSLSKAMLRVADSTEQERTAMGKCGHALVKKHFNREDVTSTYIQAISKLIG